MNDSMSTPWGVADYRKDVIEGITFYSTPSHGGFFLSPERLKQVPPCVHKSNFGHETKRGWFEEDLEWFWLVLCWPDELTQYSTETAKRHLSKYYPEIVSEFERTLARQEVML